MSNRVKETRSRAEQARIKADQEIKRAEIEDRVAAVLPFIPVSMYHHGDHTSAKVEIKLGDLPNFVATIADLVVEAEAWNSGCLSIKPAEINKYATDERAVLDGAAWAQLVLHSYGESRRYQDAAFRFWLNTPQGFVDLSVEIKPAPWKWLPEIKTNSRDQYRDHIPKNAVITPRFIGEDNRRKWWTTEGNYHFTYEWADRPNFESWLTTKDAEGGN